jgi:hypothetical protein
MKFTLETKKKRQLIMAFLLDQLIDKRDFSVVLTGNDTVLESLFVEMLSLNLIKIERNFYKIDVKGQEFMDIFFKKYSEFLKLFDIFCAVDLKTAEFAFKKFYDFDTDEEWKIYLNQENWQDVRVAVCEFKKIDPIEIVFMAFLNEGRFDPINWQFDLVSDLVWDEVLEVCNTAIPLEDLIDDDVMLDIVNQGSAIMLDILKEENKRKLEDLANDNLSREEYQEEVTYVQEETIYYEEYTYDPYYISPCWYWYW